VKYFETGVRAQVKCLRNPEGEVDSEVPKVSRGHLTILNLLERLVIEVVTMAKGYQLPMDLFDDGTELSDALVRVIIVKERILGGGITVHLHDLFRKEPLVAFHLNEKPPIRK